MRTVAGERENPHSFIGRLISTRGLLLILVILGCVCAIMYILSTKPSHDRGPVDSFTGTRIVELSASYGTYLMGVSQNSDASFSIWVYDWTTMDFQVLVATQHRPDILEGSTREVLAWGEEFDEDDGSYARYLMVRPGDKHPVRLSYLEEYQFSRPSPYFHVQAGLIRGSNFLIANGKDFDQSYSEYTIWNLMTAERQTMVLDEPREMISFSPALGDEEKFFVIGEAELNIPPNFYCRLMSLEPFEAVAETVGPDWPFPIVAGSNPYEAVILSGYVSATLIKIEKQDSEMSLKLSVVGDIPESKKWYFSLKKSFSDAIEYARESGLISAPGAFMPNPNIDDPYWRNGFFFWRTIDPPQIKIARDAQDVGTLLDTVSLKMEPEFSFLPSQDASMLVVQTALDTFQVWSLEYPELVLGQEHKLSYDTASHELTLIKIKENK